MSDIKSVLVDKTDMISNIYLLIPWVLIFIVVQLPILVLGVWWQKANPDKLVWAILAMMSMSLSYWLLYYLLRKVTDSKAE